MLTWNTLGALTRLARAEERVAAKIPAVTNGPNHDTISITWEVKKEHPGIRGGRRRRRRRRRRLPTKRNQTKQAIPK